ncbi:pyridoxal-phosphate dependent enzyme [Vibrio intestinalis]|uniref:pyridoxal-phosphate dependent enzyme n=1 Tax=Vibrio intestinalis TaxID=2933291 RepID=UPI0021A368E2|nr:pyridoxal-phosphate dependent enzyme [Vibrio intestinalis]
MQVYPHITEAIQHPHIIDIGDQVYVAKFECMKVYSTLTAIDHLIKKGTLKVGDTVVDSSSGIYAHALALACHRFGLKCHIIASKTVDDSFKTQLSLLGATYEPAPSGQSLKLDQEFRVNRIKHLLAESPNVHWMQQYHDDIHYLGYQKFAQKICHSLDLVPDDSLTLIGGVGTGCSTGGTAHYLRGQGINLNVQGIQPFGSVTFGAEFVDDPEAVIAGIGSAIPFNNVRHDIYQDIHWMSFNTCLSGSLALMKEHAIFAGLSSGAGLTVARWLRNTGHKSPILLIAPDTGHRYLEAVFQRPHLAEPIDSLEPKKLSHLSELSMPWSVIPWPQLETHFTPKHYKNNRLAKVG